MESEEEGLLLESVWDSEPGIIDYLQVKWQGEGKVKKNKGRQGVWILWLMLVASLSLPRLGRFLVPLWTFS
jgi:hypothetical protein